MLSEEMPEGIVVQLTTSALGLDRAHRGSIDRSRHVLHNAAIKVSGGSRMAVARFRLSSTGDKTTDYIDVEVDESPNLAQLKRVSSKSGDVLDAGVVFEDALRARLAPLTRAVRAAVEGAAPDALELGFAFKLSAESGFIVVKGTAEATFTVKLTWTSGGKG